MNLKKDEKIVECEVRWKMGVITDTMILMQSEIQNNELIKKFEDNVKSCIVKCYVECFGAGRMGDYIPEVHINNVLDKNYSVELSEAEEDRMYDASRDASYK